MMLDTLKTLCYLNGISGFEDEVRDYILERAMPYADKITTDRMGNLLVFKKGRVELGQKLMLCAHMDEVGLIITGISDEGYLRFDLIGGIDRRTLIGKCVYVGNDRIPGIIGIKAYHHVKSEERSTVPEIEALYVDIGAKSVKEAESLAHPGDPVFFEDNVLEFGEGYLKAKAIDDRLGCAIMLKLIEEELPCDTWFVFTVQEEVGARGAFTAAFGLEPDIALIIEGTTAADIPEVDDRKIICRLGGGVVIPYIDKGAVYDRELYGILTSLADRREIKWQTKQSVSGGTDGSSIQRSRTGVHVAAVAAGVRNIHSPACVAKISDIQALMDLVCAFLEEMAL